MKKGNSILAIILLAIMTGCVKDSKQTANDFITTTNDLIAVDVTKSYSPEKELILQDFMDVEYIVLETTDEFVNQGHVQAIGKDILLVKNYIRDGDIFVYDRTGKALRKINRKGQGGEEYTDISGITLDEDNNEMFVSDIFTKKILVYDLYGKFKRRFKHNKGVGSTYYGSIFNYDKENLICYDKSNEETAFVLVSKQDGSITREIKIPFEKKLSLTYRKEVDMHYSYTAVPGPYRTIIPFKGDWILIEHSSDTVYTFLPDYSLRPFIVRTPPIQFMDPGVFLMLNLLSDRFILMGTVKKVYDFDTNSGFPRTYLMYDRQEKAVLGYNVYNGDYTTKTEINLNHLVPVNHEIESWESLKAYRLIESYEKGELKGKLKEIAAKLIEDDNPVIMLIKHKK